MEFIVFLEKGMMGSIVFLERGMDGHHGSCFLFEKGMDGHHCSLKAILSLRVLQEVKDRVQKPPQGGLGRMIRKCRRSPGIVENAERIAPPTRQTAATDVSFFSKCLWLQFGASEVRSVRRFPLFLLSFSPKALKTNEKSTFLVLILSKTFKTEEKSKCLRLGASWAVLGLLGGA